MADDLLWEEPPRRHQKSEWFAPLLALKERPNSGARLGRYDTSVEAVNLASTVRNAAKHLAPAHPDGEWEITSRAIPAGGHGVWAWWKPAKEQTVAGKSVPEEELQVEEGPAWDPAQLEPF